MLMSLYILSYFEIQNMFMFSKKFTNWKMFINFINMFGSLKKCSCSKICSKISKNVHIYMFCWKFRKMFCFQNCLQILKKVVFLKFSWNLEILRVEKLFVFPNFVLKFEKLFLFSFLGSLKNVSVLKNMFASPKFVCVLKNVWVFSKFVKKTNNVRVW